MVHHPDYAAFGFPAAGDEEANSFVIIDARVFDGEHGEAHGFVVGVAEGGDEEQ